MASADVFPDNYLQARLSFSARAGALGWQVLSYPIEGRGPDNEELAIDVAIGTPGPRGETDCLVVSSGLHGVEGFLGSALQCALLQRWMVGAERPPQARCVFVHGLNPYGMAWWRRTNADNIDLNRNFLLPGEEYQGCPPAYTTLNDWLNPRQPPGRRDWLLPYALGSLIRMGLPALKVAIASGQYAYPQGLFYGGAAATSTQRLLADCLSTWLADSERVVHLDLHSGLGPWGSCKLLIDYPLQARQWQRLAAWFGAGSIEVDTDARTSAGLAYRARGGLGPWCVAMQPQRDYVFAYAEFGTYNLLRMLAGLRRENQAHFWGQDQDPATRAARTHLRELFCPASSRWRDQVLRAGLQVMQQAVAAVSPSADRPGE